MAAASSFNGFTPTEKMYVCSVQPEYFEGLIAGPTEAETASTTTEQQPAQHDKRTSPEEDVGNEEKKEDLVC